MVDLRNKIRTRSMLPSQRPLVSRWRELKIPLWLYAIECEGFVRVGMTTKVETRLKGLQSANPFPVKLIYSARIPARIAVDVERAALIALERDHHHSDWFTTNPDEAVAAITDTVARFMREHPPPR